MEDDLSRPNLIYEYASIMCGNQHNFSTTVMGETPEERFSNTIYLITFILKDVLLLRSREEAEKYFEKYPDEYKDTKLEYLIKDSKNISILGVPVVNQDLVFRYAYGEISSFDDIRDWLENGKNINKRTRAKLIKAVKDNFGVDL